MECRHPPLEKLMNLYTTMYVQHLDLNNQNQEHHFETISNNHHFIQNLTIDDTIACKYTFVTLYRKSRYPYRIKYAKLVDHESITKGPLKFYCEPISFLQPTLVQTDECENGFFKFGFKFEPVTLGYKLIKN
ncbi:hypothetical protein BpHYR1_050629 [Brachionus plicatilis]|uniref:Uncharacterized protein n=1 Tax=Brachionus plicatilis TaxID=10195 RepID=A0A3M7P5J8_BRAPC|nr:hypothetical protein BpHYR1_050629 [Brachionus plicatilis]